MSLFVSLALFAILAGYEEAKKLGLLEFVSIGFFCDILQSTCLRSRSGTPFPFDKFLPRD